MKTSQTPGPLSVLRHHVSGAIERGEAVPVVEVRPPADLDEALCRCLMRMVGDHWEALEYVQATGSQPLMEEAGAVEDLLEWGAVVRSRGWRMQLTQLGTMLLEEQNP